MTSEFPKSAADQAPALATDEIYVAGPASWSMSGSLIARLNNDPRRLVIYKLFRGRQDYAAYLVARRLGWPPIPESVFRDGPRGPGLVQVLLERDLSNSKWLWQVWNYDRRYDELYRLVFRQIAIMDYLCCNTDRKPDHVFLDREGKIWSVDHNTSFYADGRPVRSFLRAEHCVITDALAADLAQFDDAAARAELEPYLTPEALAAFFGRLRQARTGRIPPHKGLFW